MLLLSLTCLMVHRPAARSAVSSGGVAFAAAAAVWVGLDG